MPFPPVKMSYGTMSKLCRIPKGIPRSCNVLQTDVGLSVFYTFVNHSALPQVGILKIVCPVEIPFKNRMLKLLKRCSGRIRPQTRDHRELQPKFQRPAPTCSNAMLQDAIYK